MGFGGSFLWWSMEIQFFVGFQTTGTLLTAATTNARVRATRGVVSVKLWDFRGPLVLLSQGKGVFKLLRMKPPPPKPEKTGPEAPYIHG